MNLDILNIVNEEIQSSGLMKEDLYANNPYLANYGKQPKDDNQNYNKNSYQQEYKNPYSIGTVNGVQILKNPNNLNDVASSTRAVLLKNGDFYVAKNWNIMHEDMLNFLFKKGIIKDNSHFKDYYKIEPNEFIAVQRIGNTNKFGTSSAAIEEFGQKHANEQLEFFAADLPDYDKKNPH